MKQIVVLLVAAGICACSSGEDGTKSDGGAGDADGDADTDADADSDTDSDGDTDTTPETPPDCVRYVDGDVASSGDGLSWTSAFVTVQEGINAAAAEASSETRCHVWVAEGTYRIYQSGPHDTVKLKNYVKLYGGFSGDESLLSERDWEDHRTILDGREEEGSENRVYHVVSADRVSGGVFDGFTVTGGNADQSNPDDRGGGLAITRSAVVVANCEIVGNTAVWGGGVVVEACAPVIEDCVVSDNEAGFGGGGLYITYSASPAVSGCTISGNYGGGKGGGIFTLYDSAPEIVDCLFEDNEAESGGGMYNRETAYTVRDSTFRDNYAGVGGGIYDYDTEGILESCVLTRNQAEQLGGGLAAELASNSVVGCTISGNTAGSNGGGLYGALEKLPSVTNSIFWGNSPDEIFSVPGDAIDVTYSAVEGGAEGEGNIDSEPRFVDEDNGDLHLKSDSPCIDAADGNAATEHDKDAEPRQDDPDTPNTGEGPPWADIGAYEYQP